MSTLTNDGMGTNQIQPKLDIKKTIIVRIFGWKIMEITFFEP